MKGKGKRKRGFV